MKKFICLILVLSLLVSSVGAVEVYEVEADTDVVDPVEVYEVEADTELLEPVSKPKYQTMASLLGSGASTFAIDDEYTDHQLLWLTASTLDDIWSDNRHFWGLYLDDFDTLLTRVGALAANVQLIQSEVDLISTKMPDVLTKLEGIDDSVDQVSEYINILMGYVSDVETAVHSLSPVITALGPVITQPFILPSGNYYLDTWGDMFVSDKDLPFISVFNSSVLGLYNNSILHPGSNFLGVSGDLEVTSSRMSLAYSVASSLLGIRSLMTLPSGSSYLGSDGDSSSVSYDLDVAEVLSDGFLGLRSLITMTKPVYLTQSGTVGKYNDILSIDTLLRDSMLGLRSLIAGSAADNEYSGISINNENLSSSFTETGLGPMLNTWLGDIQNDVGVLSYVFASPQDLELKKESESNMDAVGDTILSSDSKSSVKVKDITDISSASDSIQELGETGVTPGQAFEQLINGSQFGFFSQEVFDDLHTVPQTFSRDSSTQIVTNFYDQSREEFYSMIGKG